jgi:hypothetical protein
MGVCTECSLIPPILIPNLLCLQGGVFVRASWLIALIVRGHARVPTSSMHPATSEAPSALHDEKIAGWYEWASIQRVHRSARQGPVDIHAHLRSEDLLKCESEAPYASLVTELSIRFGGYVKISWSREEDEFGHWVTTARLKSVSMHCWRTPENRLARVAVHAYALCILDRCSREHRHNVKRRPIENHPEILGVECDAVFCLSSLSFRAIVALPHTTRYPHVRGSHQGFCAAFLKQGLTSR